MSIGRFLIPNAAGVVESDAAIDKIDPSHLPLIDAVVELCAELFERDVHSVYLRGSCARGLFLPDVSDADFFLLVRNQPSRQTCRNLNLRSGEVAKCFALPKIDLDVFDIAKFLNYPALEGQRFLLKTQSVCVAGQDVRTAISPFRFGFEICFAIRELGNSLRSLERLIAKSKDPQLTSKWIRWCAKKVIRASFELVLPREGRYTRDLCLCFESFCKYYPSMKNAALRVFQNVVGDKMLDLQSAEDTIFLGRWLIAKWETQTERNETTRGVIYEVGTNSHVDG